jgi:hypothetical protein
MSNAALASAQLEAVLARDPKARAVAIRMEAAAGLPATLNSRGRQFQVRWCESRLAMREALCDLDAKAEADGMLLITPLADHQLPADIAARLAKARVFQAKDWEILRPMFGATSVDARLSRYDWMAQSLIEAAAVGPFPTLTSRFLDLDSAWREFLQRSLGLQSARPDAVELFRWTMEALSQQKLTQLAPAVQKDVLDWFEHECGEIGVLVASSIRANRGSDALALATACGVIFAQDPSGQSERAHAAIRLERYLGDRHVSAEEGRRWATEARRMLQLGSAAEHQSALDRADALLNELKVAEFAFLSDLTPRGLEQRMQNFAQTLVSHLKLPSSASCGAVEEAANDVLQHGLAQLRPLRTEQLQMARRLARWLVVASPESGDYRDLVEWQSDQGAFVDWARFRLLGGDDLKPLTDAYAQLRARVTEVRARLNRRFAQALAAVNKENRWQQGRAIPLESVLDRIVAPTIAQHPAVLLVVDGLSLAIFRELFARPQQHGWMELVDEQSGRPWVGVAALPTVTETSRTSLLCGQMCRGAAQQEKSAFSKYPALLAQSSSKKPPELFHKADLIVDGGLAERVRAALSDQTRKIVGIVYNAVDDHLSGPEQLHSNWSLEHLRLLLPLLQAAREARRVLILTADHGHVLEEASHAIPGADSDRWRSHASALTDGEALFSGGRVRCPDGSDNVVCLVDESLRYTGRKNGYHGGVSLQEVCVPLSVFVPFGVSLEGWSPAPPQQPEWWDLPQLGTPQAVVVARSPRRAPKPNDLQASLFASPQPIDPPAADVEWIGKLLASATYQAQRQLAARVALQDAQMRTLLTALDERGGKLSWSALAQRLAIQEMRLPGLLSAARRTLNVDQSPVLAIDESGRMVELNRPLLERQFGASP